MKKFVIFALVSAMSASFGLSKLINFMLTALYQAYYNRFYLRMKTIIVFGAR